MTPSAFDRFLRQLRNKNWAVYAKPPFSGPQYVIQYLARYTERVAISNGRLVEMKDGQVTFRWRDSAQGNRQKLMTLAAVEFIRRYLLHCIPSHPDISALPQSRWANRDFAGRIQRNSEFCPGL